MNFGKQWQLGLRIFLILAVISFFIYVMIFLAFGPAAVLVYVAEKEGGALGIALRVAAIAYVFVLSPVVLAWLAGRGGLPAWGSLVKPGSKNGGA